jgi:hypothetical protein
MPVRPMPSGTPDLRLSDNIARCSVSSVGSIWEAAARCWGVLARCDLPDCRGFSHTICWCHIGFPATKRRVRFRWRHATTSPMVTIHRGRSSPRCQRHRARSSRPIADAWCRGAPPKFARRRNSSSILLTRECVCCGDHVVSFRVLVIWLKPPAATRRLDEFWKLRLERGR